MLLGDETVLWVKLASFRIVGRLVEAEHREILIKARSDARWGGFVVAWGQSNDQNPP